MTKWKIYNEDAVEWAKNYRKARFHAMFCDAPYHLTSIVKRFGKKGSAPAQFGTDGVFSRASKGFMGTQWDGGDLAFRPETWEAFGEVLYPGAFGMAFSASRNWHRMAVAIEDAGFVLHPTIFLWSYGQGFPKATNISAQLDKRDGLIGNRGKAFRTAGAGDRKDLQGKNGVAGMTYTDPKSNESAQWVGHRYGLQALKPAVEPIIVFQKPYEGKPLENIVSTGAGALNIDGARIPLAGDGDEYVINEFVDGAKPFGNGAGHKYKSKKVAYSYPKGAGGIYSKKYQNESKIASDWNNFSTSEDNKPVEGSPLGRWPSNLILDGSGERLDAQTGKLQSGGKKGSVYATDKKGTVSFGLDNITSPAISDSGGASRFFYQVQEQLDEHDPVYYCGKASPKERQAGLEDKNIHPTLKPIDLCKYLATLLLPPEGYVPRRIFIPFSGVASEMIGAGLAGWEHVVGVEFDKENGYVDIAKKRLDYWLKEK